MADAQLTPEVREVLERSTITGNNLVLPPGQLDRKLYEAVNKCLVNAGGKWNRSAKAHVFDSDPRAKLGLMLETGVSEDAKKKLQSFYTPELLAYDVAMMARVKGHVVLEPSAGGGALVKACIAQGARAVKCLDINPEACEKLTADGMVGVVCCDFLEYETEFRYSRIVMNPPFSGNQDIKHVAHALNLLAPKGILVAIMSPNVEREAFKKLIVGRQYEISDVDAGAFAESGTKIKTIILRIFNR